jgi:uncharacterized protein involved in exopolysaccharide biosynthesis
MLLAQQSAHDNPDIDSLQNQIQLQAQQVSAIYLKLAKIKDELTRQGIPIPPTAGGKTELELRERDLVVAKEDCAARQALLDQIKDMPDEEIANTISTLGLSDFGKDYSALQKIRGDAFDLQQQIDKLNKDGPSKDNSQLVVLRTQLDQKKQGLKATVEGIKRDMQVDLAMAKARVQMLQKEVDDMQASAGQKPNPLLEPYYATNRDLENQQNLLNALQTRLQQVETDRRLVESPVRIISRAEAPQSPSSPDRKADFVTSLVIGIVMAIGVAMLVEGLARKS